MKVMMVPSVSGGIGHISRTATLARALAQARSPTSRSTSCSMRAAAPVQHRRRAAAWATGRGSCRRVRPRAAARSCAPVSATPTSIVDDVARYLRAAPPPRAACGLDLDRDAPAPRRAVHGLADDGADGRHHLGLPPGGGPAGGAGDRCRQDRADRPVPRPRRRTGARPRRVPSWAIDPAEPVVVYAPRGFPFGKEFGHRMVAAIYGAIGTLRQDAPAPPAPRPACRQRSGGAAQRRGPAGGAAALGQRARASRARPMPCCYQRAADILVAEGTSTIHEGAALWAPPWWSCPGRSARSSCWPRP